jgi:hypothetical protein
MKMTFEQSREILESAGFAVKGASLNESTGDRYVFKESDEEWIGEFLKRYDAYGDFGWSVKEKVESYSNGILTFENTRGYLDDDNTAEFSWFVDAHELFADADDVKAFMASYKPKRKRLGKREKNWTAAEIAKLIRDNGLSIDSIIDALENGEG